MGVGRHYPTTESLAVLQTVECLPHEKFPVVPHAVDLGVTVTYSGSRVKQKDRIQQAIAMMARIAQLPLEYKDKQRLVSAGALPKALYGIGPHAATNLWFCLTLKVVEPLFISFRVMLRSVTRLLRHDPGCGHQLWAAAIERTHILNKVPQARPLLWPISPSSLRVRTTLLWFKGRMFVWSIARRQQARQPYGDQRLLAYVLTDDHAY